MLTSKPAATSGRPELRQDDNSGHAHRQLIGYIGLVLPIVLVIIAGVRNAEGASRWQPLGSISSYYYSGAVAAFIGLLVALALFLFTYRGYGNKHHRADRIIAVTAGLGALGVAFFPTGAHAGAVAPDWWTPMTGRLHYASAIVLFGAFAAFSLWLFRLGAEGETPTQDKQGRNLVHLFCGLGILLGMGWTLLNGLTKRPIFLPESVVLGAFAISWLVKGYAHRTVAAGVRSIVKREVPQAITT
jgi:hypothetical protein